MRYVYRNVVRYANGIVVSGATVHVYLAGTTTAAKVYADSSTLSSTSLVSSGSDGTVVFYVDELDYQGSQKFKITITVGTITTTLDDVVIFPADRMTWTTLSSGTIDPNSYSLVLLDCSSGDKSFSIVALSSVGVGKTVTLLKDNSANIATITGLDSALFNDDAFLQLGVPNETVKISPNGTKWLVVGY